MARKLTYEELKQRLKELEEESISGRRAEEALRETERDFSALAENAYTGILIALPNGQHVYANKRAAEITGYSITELTEINMSRLAHPDEVPGLVERLKRRMAGESVPRQYETRILRKDGEPITIEVTGAKTVWHEQVADIVIFLDITGRKKAEDDLRKSEERFRTIYENAPVLIDAFDEKGRCILWNRECEKVFGWTMDEINAHDEPLALFYPDPGERGRVIGTVILKPDKTFRESRPVTKDGKEVTALWANFQVPDGTIINIGYDVTERRRAEEELRRHRDMLGELVRERTSELETKSRSLEEFNVALKVLLRQVEKDREVLEHRLVSNVSKLVLPYVEKMKKCRLDKETHSYLSIVEGNLSEIMSPFLHSVQQLNLTPRETQVASLIRDGNTTKDIAEIIGIAPSGVNTHRNNLRSKLGLRNKKINLRSYLQSLK